MTKVRWLCVRLVLLILVLAAGGLPLGGLAWGQVVRNPDTLVIASSYGVETLDPAWQYDDVSAQAIFNIYETLIFYDRERGDRFIPQLATEVPSLDNGLIRVNPDGTCSITFPIRRGVRFHRGGELDPRDVEYTFERLMLQDRAGGPAGMFLEPLLGVSSIDELAAEVGDREACLRVKQAVEADMDAWTVTFHLNMFAPFLALLARPWASVLDREWVMEQGGWDGSCDHWRRWHDPEAWESELFDKANGTGPFELERWVPGEGISLRRNEGYWQSPARLARAVIEVVPEFSQRLALLRSGEADIIEVPRAAIPQLEPPVREEVEGGLYLPERVTIRNPEGIVRVFKDLPQPSMWMLLFNFRVADDSPFMPLLGGEPEPDLFSDVHLRRAFNRCFDWEAFLQGYGGEAEHPRGPLPRGIFGYNPDQPRYHYDPERCEEELKLAWGGELWEEGFQVTLTSAFPNRIDVEPLAASLRALNPRFQVNTLYLPWPERMRGMRDGTLPVLSVGYEGDLFDPHEWALALLGSGGPYAPLQHLDVVKDASYTFRYIPELAGKTKAYATLQGLFDELEEMGEREMDPERRELIYFELQNAFHKQPTGVLLYQALGRHYERTWVRGWYYNPAYPGTYLYPLWKG